MSEPYNLQVPSRRRFMWKWRWVVYPLMTIAGCHTMMTGSPIPLWHLETLSEPVSVQEVLDDCLVLIDGRRVALPFIARIAKDNPLFLAAIESGVEIRAEGQVIGLLNANRGCGNDPVAWYRLRVDLSELSAALMPDGMNTSELAPEVVQCLTEYNRLKLSARNPKNLPAWGTTTLAAYRRVFEWVKQRRPVREPETWTFSIPLDD